MTRILALAALLTASALALPETANAAKGGFKGGFKPVPFRANGLLGPVTPKTLSHSGLPAKFHGHHKKHLVQPLIVGLTGGLALINPYRFPDAPDQAPVRPVLVPVGGTVGCVIEDVAMTGGRTVSIIRC